jgi:hypothetical protein
MCFTLDFLREGYGCFEVYLRSIGVDDQMQERVLKKLLV